MIDLWPTEIQTAEIVAPYTIVKEQGNMLGKRTSNLLLGRIKRTAPSGDYDFGYIFQITAVSLGYQYDLFRFYSGADLYPVKIVLDEEISKELSQDNRSIEANTEEEFMEILKKIFASEKTKRLISALLAQIHE